MLTGSQKRELRKMANSLEPIFQVGKDGVSLSMLDGIENALLSRELIKVKVLDTCPEDKRTVALKISEYTKAEVVQIIGRTIVLYLRVRNGKIKV